MKSTKHVRLWSFLFLAPGTWTVWSEWSQCHVLMTHHHWRHRNHHHEAGLRYVWLVPVQCNMRHWSTYSQSHLWHDVTRLADYGLPTWERCWGYRD